jgi:hypothetical protein
MWVLFGILAISAWALGSAIQAWAESMNFKVYTYVTKAERISIGDVEGHTIGLTVRGSFYVFENGEVATVNAVATNDLIKGAGPFLNYITVNFADGSTIIIKGEGTLGAMGASGTWKSEITKGTGRFGGITGTANFKVKYLPVEKGEAGAKGHGEGTINYTLPSK